MYITVETVHVVLSVAQQQPDITEMPNSCGLFSEFHARSQRI
jgi:hypothetical protein